RTDGTFGATVAFRSPHERGTRLDAEEGDLLLEGVAHVLATVVVPQLQPAGDVAPDRPEVFAHALADRFQCLPARRTLDGVDANDFRRVVIHGEQHRGLAFLEREGCRQIGAPAQIRGLRNDGALVALRSPRPATAGRRLQTM